MEKLGSGCSLCHLYSFSWAITVVYYVILCWSFSIEVITAQDILGAQLVS
uniref:Uncharacterized protein n=1 Tax=Arundo donax TaxID=35708 RepID=A0A0A9EYM5_ARUDO